MACLHLTNTLKEPDIVKCLITNGATVDIATKVNYSMIMSVLIQYCIEACILCDCEFVLHVFVWLESTYVELCFSLTIDKVIK